jgi:hypothetical protein
MPSIDNALKWMTDKIGRVTYSMTDRNGPNTYDCSSSVYHALIAGEFFPPAIWIGNTDSLFGDLEKRGWVALTPDATGNYPTQRGDVFIWGTRGQSTGGFGHTGMFVDADNVVHCSYGYNGMAISNHDWLYSIQSEHPPVTFYHYVGTSTPSVEVVDQVVNTGSWVKFDKTYTVDDIQDISQNWQIHTNELCTTGFTWDDNGIPAAIAVKVDADGFMTDSQELAAGELYKIPGKFQVTDLGQTNGEWMAQIGSGGLSFWVDIATATEVGPDDSGTPVPVKKPIAQPVVVPPVPEATPTPQPAPTPAPVPVAPVSDTPAPTPVVTPIEVTHVPAEHPITVTTTPTPKASWLGAIIALITKFFEIMRG